MTAPGSQFPTAATFALEHLDLQTMLAGGQAFRWQVASCGTTATGVVAGNLWEVRWSPPGFTVHCLSPQRLPESAQVFATWYFDLERDYRQVFAQLAQDEHLQPLLQPKRGLRLLRQEWFEVMVSFVLSANNHIARISRSVELLAARYGTPFSAAGTTCFAFPTPTQLAQATAQDLRKYCNTGYRDRYLMDLALQVSQSLPAWNQSATTATGELRTWLLDLPGVGPKVADCILLFGFGRWDVFPVDTWVRKAVQLAYFPDQPPFSDQKLRAFALERFGPLAGFAQQVLFEAIRR